MTIERDMIPAVSNLSSDMSVLPQPRIGDHEALSDEQRIIDYSALGNAVIGSANIWGVNTPTGLPVIGCLPHYLNLANRHTLPN